MTSVHVGNLKYETTEEQLQEAFAPFGEIVKCRLVKRPDGKSKGFGFIDFATAESAMKAIKEMHDKLLNDRAMNVHTALPPKEPTGKPRPQRGGGERRDRDRDTMRVEGLEVVAADRYPLYDAKPIPWKPPSAYFYEKPEVNVEPEPEITYVKAPAREINPKLLSADQRRLYGRTMFEKDMVILKDRDTRRSVMDLPVKSPANPPSLYFREEDKRRRKEDEEVKRQAENVVQTGRRKRRVELKEKEEHDRIRRVARARKELQEEQIAMEHSERMQALTNRARKAAATELELGRPTRASALKASTSKARNEQRNVEMRREEFNEEMRKENIKEARKRVKRVVKMMNCQVDPKKSMEMMKNELRQREKEWAQWLEVTERQNAVRSTMLERTFWESSEPRSKRGAGLPRSGK